MMVRVLAGLLLMLAMAGGAQAASFDCKKATTPFETAICTHADLSSADDLLAVAYATAIGGLSKPALAAMQANQRGWLDYAQRACTDDAEPMTTAYTDDKIDCLRQTFDNRVRVLEKSRMETGLRFYTADSYAVIPDSTAEVDAWNKVATREVSAPRIDATTPEAEALNGLVEGIVAASGEIGETEDSAVSVSVGAVTSSRISLELNAYWYGHGAAHGNYEITYQHFLREPGRALAAADMFERDGWEAALGELALAELDRTIDGGIWPESREQAAASAADPSRWDFSARGLVIQYQPYEVTAYAYGAPTITIPWMQLTEYLSADASAIGEF